MESDVVRAMRYKFVRYCINKAYAEMDFGGVPAEVINVFDDVVDQIRRLEKYFTSIESIKTALQTDIAEKLRALKERDPNFTKAFVDKVVEHCLEIEEIAGSEIRQYIEMLREVV
jgi:transcription termination factor NusB